MSHKRTAWLDGIKLVALVAVLVAVFAPSGCGLFPHDHPHTLEDIK